MYLDCTYFQCREKEWRNIHTFFSRLCDVMVQFQHIHGSVPLNSGNTCAFTRIIKVGLWPVPTIANRPIRLWYAVANRSEAGMAYFTAEMALLRCSMPCVPCSQAEFKWSLAGTLLSRILSAPSATLMVGTKICGAIAESLLSVGSMPSKRLPQLPPDQGLPLPARSLRTSGYHAR
jgi:hypothetical protein